MQSMEGGLVQVEENSKTWSTRYTDGGENMFDIYKYFGWSLSGSGTVWTQDCYATHIAGCPEMNL